MCDHLGHQFDLNRFCIGATIMFSKNNTMICNYDAAVSSSENPVLVNQGSSAEMDTIGELERDLPGPRARYGILPIHNPAADSLWFNSRNSTTQSRGHQSKADEGDDQ